MLALTGTARARFPAWHTHPDVWALFGAIVLGYVLACRHRRGRTGAPAATRRQAVCFGLGVLTLLVASD